jgi:hypothetical protein
MWSDLLVACLISLVPARPSRPTRWRNWLRPNASMSANIVPKERESSSWACRTALGGLPWLRSSSARHGLLLLRRNLIVGCEHRAAAIGELRRVLPQAGDDALNIGDLAAAQPPDIRRASHLLFPRAAIFFRVGRAMRDNAADRKRETKRNLSNSHIRTLHVSLKASPINEAREGSWPTTKREEPHGNWNLSHPADALHRRA